MTAPRAHVFLPALACLLLTAACLPEAGPGIGERLLAGRGINRIDVPSGLAPNDVVVYDQVTRDPSAPVSPPGEDEIYGPARSNAVYALSPAQPGPRLLVKGNGTGCFGDRPSVWDGLNRLWMLFVGALDECRGPRDGDANRTLFRFDLTSGSTTTLGMAVSLIAAPDGKAIVVSRASAQAEVHDLEGHVQDLQAGVGQLSFVGPHLYFINPMGLHRLSFPLGQPARLLLARARAVIPVPGHEAEQLLLVDVAVEGADRTVRQLGLLRGDEVAPQLRVLAQGRFVSEPVLSPQGDRLGLVESIDSPGVQQVRIIALETGNQETVRIATSELRSASPGGPCGGGGPLSPAFRPHSNELWLFQSTCLFGVFANANEGVRRLEHTGKRTWPLGEHLGEVPWRAVFTSDGRHWVYGRTSDFRVQVGDADHPEASADLDLGHLHPIGRTTFQEVEPGKLLLLGYPGGRNGDRQDLLLADPSTRQLTTLARNVGSIRVGALRVIAIVDRLLGTNAPGHLVSIDLRSGLRTTLAGNVTEFALSPVCETCDPTAPGIKLHYVVQPRLPFGHDGLWRATLP